MTKTLSEKLSRLRREPIALITEALVNPENSRRFELFEAEGVFLKYAFTPTEGQFRYEIAYRPAPAPPRRRWDERPSDASRLYGRGEDLARVEDANAARLGRSWSSRWRNSGF